MNTEELIALLDTIEERLGGPAAYAFDLALRQIYVDAIGWTILAIFSWVAYPLIIRPIYVRWKNADAYSDWGIIFIFSSLTGGIGLFFVTAMAFSALMKLMNPEWWAIHNLGGLWPQ